MYIFQQIKLKLATGVGLVLMFLISFSVFAESQAGTEGIEQSIKSLKIINGKLLDTEDEAALNTLIAKKVNILHVLVQQLKSTMNPQFASVIDNQAVFLESRIAVNIEKGHPLAAQRDQVKLETYIADQAITTYLGYLIKASNDYYEVDAIIKESQKLLEQSEESEKQLLMPEVAVAGKVYRELKDNHRAFLQSVNSYQDILLYIINNPRNIASIHWFDAFSLSTAIATVNDIDLAKKINHKLAPFKIDTGGVTLSFVIFFLVYFSYPFVFKCTSWFFENHVIEKGSEQQELIYHQIRKPARTLLIFFALNLGTHAFFYKTDYRSSLEGVAFILYSLIFIWLLFKIVDSIVLVQIEKLSSSNKALRKELFNLGVKSVKALIAIIVLAFGLNHFGISLTAIMSTLGVGGLAFALAAKDTLSNLFGGITILFDNVFRMGDWVKMGDVEGTVAEIGLRSTTIRTFDNALITIPNSMVSVSTVMNWNRRAVGRRIKMYVGVTYESDMDDLRKALEDIREMLRNHPDIANPSQKHGTKRQYFKFSSKEDMQGIKSTQLVFMDRYNDFSIDILIYCFARTVNWAKWLAVKEDVLFKIAAILEKNNLEFAYPTQVRIYRPEAAQSNKEMMPPSE